MALIPIDPNQRPEDAGQYRITQDYVMGLAFNAARDRVVLIRKNKPAHLKDKWNGVGGKMDLVPEGGYELPQDAMAREFEEETGVKTDPDAWEPFGSLNGSWGTVHLYRLFSDGAVAMAQTMEEEIVYTFPVKEIPDTTLTNTRWLIGIALDPSKPMVDVRYEPGY